VFEEAVEAAGEVALEAADGFAVSLAFADASVDVVDRGRVGSAPGDEDVVEGAVQLAVAAAVEAVSDGLAGGGGDRCCARESGERRFGCEAARVRPAEHDLCGHERADARLLEELWCERAGERLDLRRQLAFLAGERLQ
jgi:hypothetical protein